MTQSGREFELLVNLLNVIDEIFPDPDIRQMFEDVADRMMGDDNYTWTDTYTRLMRLAVAQLDNNNAGQAGE